ncbi:hypothetical protein TH53_19815 [Pedobacter lusitanus]|uniref:Uncharacterized protein n=1 Tax=Pedobacter lusitanus TaxID=1503925 RepID=A0A0D0GE14_9SPHI|nr:hypothetical protein [Pedobacter lusitanus]KIO75587.1 hypothetical protein TH53_19815 [Pedobacter lusitanus]
MGISHYGRQRGDNVRLRPLVKEALLAKCWLFDKVTGAWWLPWEFEERYFDKELCNHDIDELLENVIVRPFDSGVRAAEKQIINAGIEYSRMIIDLKNKLEDFKRKDIEFREGLKQRGFK